MKLKKTTIIVTILSLLGLLSCVYNPDIKIKDKTSKKHISLKKDNLKNLNVKSKDKEVLTKTSIVEQKVAQIQKKQVQQIFKIEDLDEIKLRQKPIEGVEPVSAISIRQNSIHKLKVGSILRIPISDEIFYDIYIQDKTINNNGSVSINGEYKDNDIKYSAIITEGKRSLFGSITTPFGAYEIEILNEEGYVYNRNDITRVKIDFTKKDTKVIPNRQ